MDKCYSFTSCNSISTENSMKGLWTPFWSNNMIQIDLLIFPFFRINRPRPILYRPTGLISSSFKWNIIFKLIFFCNFEFLCFFWLSFVCLFLPSFWRFLFLLSCCNSHACDKARQFDFSRDIFSNWIFFANLDFVCTYVCRLSSGRKDFLKIMLLSSISNAGFNICMVQIFFSGPFGLLFAMLVSKTFFLFLICLIILVTVIHFGIASAAKLSLASVLNCMIIVFGLWISIRVYMFFRKS